MGAVTRCTLISILYGFTYLQTTLIHACCLTYILVYSFVHLYSPQVQARRVRARGNREWNKCVCVYNVYTMYSGASEMRTPP